MDFLIEFLLMLAGAALAVAAVVVLFLSFNVVTDLRRGHRVRGIEPGYDLELQAAYQQVLERAEVELSWLLPATLACPEDERR